MGDKAQTKIVRRMLRHGKALLRAPRRPIEYGTGNRHAEAALNDIERYPHLFVLGCIMDRQIKVSRAWLIPYRVGREAGGLGFRSFRKLSLPQVRSLFKNGRYHRFNDVMARNFHAAVCRIDEVYRGDASRIWSGKPSSALVIRRFLEFEGVGIKIATMAANVLVREYKVPLGDKSAIDISPDSRVTRYFEETGLLRKGASPTELIYRARELSPRFPGLLDHLAYIDGGYVAKAKRRSLP